MWAHCLISSIPIFFPSLRLQLLLTSARSANNCTLMPCCYANRGNCVCAEVRPFFSGTLQLFRRKVHRLSCGPAEEVIVVFGRRRSTFFFFYESLSRGARQARQERLTPHEKAELARSASSRVAHAALG